MKYLKICFAYSDCHNKYLYIGYIGSESYAKSLIPKTIELDRLSNDSSSWVSHFYNMHVLLKNYRYIYYTEMLLHKYLLVKIRNWYWKNKQTFSNQLKLFYQHKFFLNTLATKLKMPSIEKTIMLTKVFWILNEIKKITCIFFKCNIITNQIKK